MTLTQAGFGGRPTLSRGPLPRIAIGLLAVALLLVSGASAVAQEAEWIWSPRHQKDAVPTGAACFFRKTFTVRNPEQAVVSIAADDTYELFVNGRRAGQGESTRRMVDYDISRLIARGNNVIGVVVANRSGATAALAARVTVKEAGGGWAAHSTDKSWKTSDRALPLWNTTLYNDAAWDAAQAFGRLGETVPWDRREDVPAAEVSRSERFSVGPEFEVHRVLEGDEIGSIIAMTFNEFGHIIASREGAGLLLVYDSNGDRIHDKVRTYCDQVKNCQGILALNGDVFVTGEGPEGLGLYRLADHDRDGSLENVRLLFKIETENAEHGPHGLVLGPDGLIYVLLGNHSKPAIAMEAGSPYRDYYEGDLVTPRYEDPGGHAAGVKAPGGYVLRTDADGSGAQIVAGGLRNPYDLCFNREGEMFIHDADMESDEGMTWYRPTRLCQVVPGGEYGWRSGWAKWPDYYYDSLPPILETGRGSPTGIVSYNHFMFPARYHGVIFTADWSQGRILAVKLKRNGASYSATSEVFVEGNPLNVTDLEVGPDGWLYFVTGGRGTSGGIYRVQWKGQVPKEVSNIGAGLSAVVRQPQMQSAFSRQNIAALRKQMGDAWDKSLIGVAKSASNPPAYRLQALELMQLYGPQPSPELLLQLSHESSELVRVRAAELMGMHDDEELAGRLVEMLDDNDRLVRRKACEALSRAGKAPSAEKLLELMASDDRFEAWAARRLLERMSADEWRDAVLKTTNHRVLVQGGLALMVAYPQKRLALDLLEKVSQEMTNFISDRDFLDMLRLIQVALIRGEILPEEVPGLRRQLAEEFPSGDPLMNRELIRLLVYLQEADITDRYMAYLKSDAADIDKLHVAMHLRFLENGWTPQQRMQLIEFYEKAQAHKGGGGYARYIINATRDFVRNFSEEDAMLVLSRGAKMPNAALGALYRVPPQIDEIMLSTLKQLDSELNDKDNESYQRLKVGIVAVLARSGDPQSMAYLREIWETDPERRQAVALGLSQQPDGENWPYLIRTLPHLEHKAAREVFNKLATVPQAPEEPEAYRHVILLGLQMKEKGSEPAIALLQFWTGEQLAADQPIDEQLEAWQQWFARKFPDQPEAVLPKAAENAKYTFEQLEEFLKSDDGQKGATSRGLSVFAKAQCVKCHRHGNQGETIGPDLTTIHNRFTQREILESIVYPSHVISSQYASKTILTVDGQTVTGIATPGPGGETIVLQADGKKVSLAADEIEAVKPSKVSAMPGGLLDTLTLEEIADLFALLESSGKVNLARPSAVRETIR